MEEKSEGGGEEGEEESKIEEKNVVITYFLSVINKQSDFMVSPMLSTQEVQNNFY